MSKGIQGKLLRHLGAKEHHSQVIAATMIAPNMRRLRFSAPTAFQDIVLTPGTYIRGWFPDENGKEHQRGYTLIDIDVEAKEYSIDFLLHEPSGPAGTWAQNAQIGEELIISPFGVRPFTVPEPTPPGYLLIADAASIPAVREIAEYLDPNINVEIYLGQRAPEDSQIPLIERPNTNIHWVNMTSDDALAKHLEARNWEGWHATILAESNATKHCKKRLREEFGFPRTHISGQAYWKSGKPMGISRELEKSQPPAEKTRTKWVSNRGADLLKPLQPVFILAGITQLIVTILQLAPFVLIAEITRALLANNPDRVSHLATAFLAIFAVGAILAIILVAAMHLVDARFTHQLRRTIIRQLSQLPLQWFTDHGRTRTKKVVGDDTISLHHLVTHAVPEAVAAIASPLLVLFYLFYVDWRVALMLLFLILAAVWIMYTMVFRSFDSTVAAPKKAEEMEAAARAFVEAHAVVATFPHTAQFYHRELDSYITFLSNWQIPFSKLKTALLLLTRPTTLFTVIILTATPLILTQSMSITDALIFVFLGTTFASALLAIGYQLQGIQSGVLASNRIAEIAYLPALPVVDETRTQPRDHTIEIDHVSYSYDTRVQALRNISLRVPNGTHCAIVGPSGAGKSTLAYLIARFADPDSGHVRIGGVDVRELTTADLYRTVGFVFQDVELIRGSIRDNIALGKPDASHADVQQAAMQAHIHAEILQLSAGYDTIIDARSGLSGGQLQRITLARLFLADPPILVMDEATAYSDPDNQNAIMHAMDTLAAGRTTITIAHRLETIIAADNIVVLDAGRITQQGTHEELLAQTGTYQQLWEAKVHDPSTT